MIFKNTLHYSLHFGLPIFISLIFFRKNWKRAYAIFLLSMLVDIDHLLADPIFDPNRCSIGIHPLHSYYAISVYFLGVFFNKTRILAIALLLHMITDYLDCIL